MNEHDLHEMMHASAAAPLDVEALVAGGVHRGRRRLRRRRAGGAATVVAAAAVVAVAVGLGAGGGSGSAHDPADPVPSSPAPPSAPVEPPVAPPVLTPVVRHSLAVDDDTVVDTLDDVLPGDDPVDRAATQIIDTTVSGDGAPAHDPRDQHVSVSTRWHDAGLSFTITRSIAYSSGGQAHLLDDAEVQCGAGFGTDPTGTSFEPHGDSCRDLGDGTWLYAAHAAPSGRSAGYTAVDVYTPGAWEVFVRADAPTGSDEPTLTEDQLLTIALDGTWFSADPPPTG